MSDRKRPRRRRRGQQPPQPRHTRGPVLIGRDVADVARACAGKSGYPSQDRAREVADRCEAKRGVRLYVYPCDLCQPWHLTSVPRSAA